MGSLKSAPSSHYTLQLSSSSNYDNLNGWAKKENLKNYVVYETTRNGQPWYVLVSGVYASKEEAKKAVSTLPADVQAKNPWAKPLRQVQADLEVIKVISRNGLSSRELPEALDAVGAFSTAGEGVIS